MARPTLEFHPAAAAEARAARVWYSEQARRPAATLWLNWITPSKKFLMRPSAGPRTFMELAAAFFAAFHISLCIDNTANLFRYLQWHMGIADLDTGKADDDAIFEVERRIISAPLE